MAASGENCGDYRLYLGFCIRTPLFILLDEPTAHLALIAREESFTKFSKVVRDKTAIYISHRLSACRFCGESLVFHQGANVFLKDTEGKYSE